MIQELRLAVALALLAFGGLAGAKDAPHPPRRPRSLNGRSLGRAHASRSLSTSRHHVRRLRLPGPRLGPRRLLWFCVTWLAPERGFAVLVTSNVGGAEAERGTDEAALAVIQDWLKR